MCDTLVGSLQVRVVLLIVVHGTILQFRSVRTGMCVCAHTHTYTFNAKQRGFTPHLEFMASRYLGLGM